VGHDRSGALRFGISQGGPAAITYAVQHPERVSHLILYGTFAQGRLARPNVPRELVEQVESLITLTRHGWGQDNPAYRQIFTTSFIPEGSPEQIEWLNNLQRVSTSGENASRLIHETVRVDVSDLPAQIRVPTLVLHARDDAIVPFGWGRELAASIPNSRFVPLDSKNHYLLEHESAWSDFLSEVRRFLGVSDTPRHPKGVPTPGLATVLFTDIEGSTALTQRLGDAKAQELVRAHNAIVREGLETHGGSEIKHTGDGIMASFPSVWRALECGVAIQRAVEERSRDPQLAASDQFRVRIGLNAGEPIAEDDDLFGTTVQLASRICSRAEAGQILVPDAVRHLAAGKGFLFSDIGEVVPKGFEEPVRLFEVRWREEG
ncbi:MAG: adenylate/guanylate cyclase domain-containing protein, partial [Armatimonadota bacterium]